MANQLKAIVSVPGWANDLHEGGEKGAENINSTALAYAYVPLIFRALRIRCDALIRPRVVLKNTEGKEVPWMFKTDPKDLLWKTEAALLLTGANYIEKLNKKVSKKTANLVWVNPTTMENPKSQKNKKTGELEFTFKQKAGSETWTLDDMVYMREFSITDDTLPGVSSAGVALNDAALIRYMGRSVTRFFETGMMPVTLLQVQNLVDEDERKRIEGFFRRVATGIRNIFKVLAMNREITPTVLSQPLKDMVIPELSEQAERNVAHAFGFNPSLFDQSANRATATEHRLALYQDTVEPRGDWIVGEFNRQVFTPMGLTMELDYSQLDIYQEDENDRASSLDAITTAINKDPKAALFVMTELLGYDLTDEQTLRYKEIFLTVTDETRTPPDDPKAQDLAKWQKKAIKLLEKGKPAVCDFASDHLDEAVHERIRAGLGTCQTPAEVKALFARVTKDYGEIAALLEGIRLEVAALQASR